MNPWADPGSYVPDPDGPNWWERNRVRATVLAAIVLIALLAFCVPESMHR